MSLIAWWPLNGDLNNYGCSSIDSLLINNNCSISAQGKIGSCYSIGPESSSYLYSNNKRILDGMESFSVSCWIKIKNWNASYQTIWSFVGTTYSWNGITAGLLRNSSTSKVCFTIANQSQYTATSCISGDLSLDTWYNIQCIYSVNGYIKMYINGELISSFSTTILPSVSRDNALTIGAMATSSPLTSTAYQNDLSIDDFRIYDHELSIKEIKELYKSCILHYDFNDPYIDKTINLGNTSANYSNKTIGLTANANSWGGDAGTCTCYSSGGYNNYPYKVYHKTATGTGGMYMKTANDIIIESGKTYTFSVYIKSNINISNASQYSFNINRGSDNYYITYEKSFNITTEWQRFEKTFTATATQAGSYGEMSIIYDDNIVDYYVYYSGFQIEENDHATPYTDPSSSRNSVLTIYDVSGYGNNGTNNGVVLSSTTNNGKYSASFDGNASNILIDSKFNYSFNDNREFSIMLNVYSEESETRDIYFGDFSTTGAINFTIERDVSNFLRFYWDGSPDYHISGFTIPVSTWVNIGIVYTGSSLSFYKDGALIETKTVTLATKTKQSGNYLFGRDGRTGVTAFKGYISDFKVYATALSASDILKEYKNKIRLDKNGNLYCGLLSSDSANTTQSFSKKAVIKTKEYNEPCIKTMSDGSKFMKIFYHNLDPNYTWFDKISVSSQALYNVGDADKFSLIQYIPRFLSHNSEYEFMLRYPNISETQYNRWKQTANPLLITSNVSQTQTTMGYTAVNINWTSKWLYGIGLSSHQDYTYLDCYAGSDEWYGTIGQSVQWGTNQYFPAPDGSSQTCVELWVRYDNTDFDPGKFKIYKNGLISANNIREI